VLSLYWPVAASFRIRRPAAASAAGTNVPRLVTKLDRRELDSAATTGLPPKALASRYRFEGNTDRVLCQALRAMRAGALRAIGPLSVPLSHRSALAPTFQQIIKKLREATGCWARARRWPTSASNRGVGADVAPLRPDEPQLAEMLGIETIELGDPRVCRCGGGLSSIHAEAHNPKGDDRDNECQRAKRHERPSWR
jgi:hypothetical protein